jgi:uncharacterized iron-regulated membrane protein
MWRRVRYWLYIGHRWLGIFACLLFATWFLSGLVMTLVGYPSLDETARRATLRPIDWSRVSVTPSELLAALPLDHYPRELALEMLLDAPVYRVQEWDGSPRTISARRIENVRAIDAAGASTIASDYAKAPARFIATIDQDQWTVPEGYGALRPLHKLAIEDELGTEVYVSAVTGEVALATTRSQRFWNWLGSVPHWIYFTDLRANQPVWRQVNLWASGPAILVAVSGIWIGFLRLKIRGRYLHATHSPYHGWKLWHHWLGIIGGLFLFTWILSGWFSVNPNQWFSGGWPSTDQWLTYAGHRSLTQDANLAAIARPDAKRVSFYYVGGRALARIATADAEAIVDARSGRPATFEAAQLFDAVAKTMPAAALIARERVVHDDLYWYSHHSERPLPVLRAVFDDPAHSWFYLDPRSGEILDFSDDGGRRYRWWFNALHRWDFSALLQYRALWYTLIWTFALTGLVMSITGVVIGWRRARRKIGI